MLALAKGARVRLRQDGQPAMRRHREALDAFLAGAIEGAVPSLPGIHDRTR